MSRHSQTYIESKPENIIHKTRLNLLLRLFNTMKLRERGSWADFGCSDGFILEQVRTQVVPKEWNLSGFDFSDDLLELAIKKNIAKSTFGKFDLNTIARHTQQHFDVVTCFETMEHVGNYKNAVDNLVVHVIANGWLIISVPNETGIPGLIKYIGRLLLRTNPYGDFFKRKKISLYIKTLLLNGDIESFRSSEIREWSQHLGFNYKNLFQYIDEKYIQSGILNLVRRESSFFGFNKIFVFQKIK